MLRSPGLGVLVALLVLAFAFSSGCGAQAGSSGSAEPSRYAVEFADAPAEDLAGGEAPASAQANSDTVANASTPATTGKRKIIYEADASLIVKDFAQLEAKLPELAKENQGYLSEVEIDRTRGEYLSGRWVVRIPVDKYDRFLESLGELGVLERFGQTAQDVTEEFVDLEARIANKQRLEERIVDLLKKSEGDIKDVIEVERELARVRSEMETMQGRLRFLQNRTSLTTIRIHAVERKDYVPPQAPTLLGRVGEAWGESLSGMRQFGEGLLVALTFCTPWLILAMVVLAPVIWYFRRR